MSRKDLRLTIVHVTTHIQQAPPRIWRNQSESQPSRVRERTHDPNTALNILVLADFN